ncbi:hypothetical protein D1AOALGA4SA_7699 [Olavius algarvensis Delta 1 endosymbiont]|nr:hypothetical protein D1AOALGA4SA_7699 [Olavius algarvensis Delta 1 endosymbiont]
MQIADCGFCRMEKMFAYPSVIEIINLSRAIGLFAIGRVHNKI